MPLEKDGTRVSLIAVDGVEERDRLNTTRISHPIAQRARERVILTERQTFCGASKKSDSQRFSVPTCMTLNKTVKNQSAKGGTSIPVDKPNQSTVAKQSTPSISPRSKFWQQVRENLQIIAIALALALLIRVFIAEPRYIPSNSMKPTLSIGDRVVVEKISYHFKPPVSGDIIVFDPPPQLQMQGFTKDQAFIKRIIATPGQIVQIQDGKVYINGEPLDEVYIAEPPNYQMAPVRVPEGQLFVMGDNRNNSDDSHVWGFLPQPNIIGHACFRFWPPSRFGLV
jgi:signal peptidase I